MPQLGGSGGYVFGLRAFPARPRAHNRPAQKGELAFDIKSHAMGGTGRDMALDAPWIHPTLGRATSGARGHGGR